MGLVGSGIYVCRRRRTLVDRQEETGVGWGCLKASSVLDNSLNVPSDCTDGALLSLMHEVGLCAWI